MLSRRIGVLSAAVALLSGCSGPMLAVPGSSIDDAPQSSTSTTSPTESVDPAENTPTPGQGSHREPSGPVSCDGDSTTAVSFSPVDASLGARDMAILIRNCSDETITLPAEPTFEGVDDDGGTYEATWVWEESDVSLQVAPDGEKLLVAHWRSNGRCERGVRELRLHLFDQTFSQQDCFQFGGDMAPDSDGTDGTLRWADVPPGGLNWDDEG